MAWIESNRIDHTGRAIGLVSAIGKGLFDGIRARQADDQIALARDDFNLRKTDSDFNRNEGFNESVRQFDINAGVNQQNADTASLNATTNKRNTDLNYSIDNRDVKAKKATQSLLFEKDAVAERNKVLVKTFNDDKAKLGKFDMTFSSWLKDSKKVTDKEYDDIARYNDVDFKKFFGMLEDAPDLQEDLLKRRDKFFTKKQADYVTKAAGDKGYNPELDPYGTPLDNIITTGKRRARGLIKMGEEDDRYTFKTDSTDMFSIADPLRIKKALNAFAALPSRERMAYAKNVFSPEQQSLISKKLAKAKDKDAKLAIIDEELNNKRGQQDTLWGSLTNSKNSNLDIMTRFKGSSELILEGFEPPLPSIYTRSQDSIKADNVLGLMDSFTEIKTAKDKEFNEAVGLLKATRDEGFKQNRLGLIDYAKGLSGDISKGEMSSILKNGSFNSDFKVLSNKDLLNKDNISSGVSHIKSFGKYNEIDSQLKATGSSLEEIVSTLANQSISQEEAESMVDASSLPKEGKQAYKEMMYHENARYEQSISIHKTGMPTGPGVMFGSHYDKVENPKDLKSWYKRGIEYFNELLLKAGGDTEKAKGAYKEGWGSKDNDKAKAYRDTTKNNYKPIKISSWNPGNINSESLIGGYV